MMRPATPYAPGRHLSATALGLSLVECLVTLVIAAILAAIAYPTLRGIVAEQIVMHAADRLAASLALGRSTAATQLSDIALIPLDGHADLNGGWQVLSTASPEAPLLTVPIPEPCLRIAPRAHRHTSYGANPGANPGNSSHDARDAHPPGIRWTAVGYSRSERGGFHAVTFVVRCHGAQRQVRLGAQGRIRICRPATDRDCDG